MEKFEKEWIGARFENASGVGLRVYTFRVRVNFPCQSTLLQDVYRFRVYGRLGFIQALHGAKRVQGLGFRISQFFGLPSGVSGLAFSA